MRHAPPPSAPSTPERCRLGLEQWRGQLQLSGRENSVLAGELAAVDRQLERLQQKRLKLAVFGRVGVGKSSLLNALLGHGAFATDVAHGCTRHQASEPWDQPIPGLEQVELVDTPGIDEIAAAGRARLAARVALGADLVLLVLDGDLNRVELEALDVLLASGKPLLLALNRCDCWPEAERDQLIASIRRRLPIQARQLELIPVAAAPRRAQLLADGRVRSEASSPQMGPLRQSLIGLLSRHGSLLLAINALRAADRLEQQRQHWRLSHSRQAAQSLIGRYAALKATGVAANPFVLLDLAAGMACDTALVLQLCQLYGLKMQTSGARQLLTRLSGHSALLGGAQLGIQLVLGLIRQLLLMAAPLTGGLSLAPAAPVAMAQAALAVHTTRLTGRLAAAELLKGAERGGRPGALLRRLALSDPAVGAWLSTWQVNPGDGVGPQQARMHLLALLP
ncbi:GTP-binding protein [Cyanobium sp. WAJ14-Wanaka]|uniref:GTP-binding protein n=1 Tax=Cyanobium sp. WAJ14-Wanaka TaxID=2823725 RepID=UPI0020CE7520|nr:GTP-binding protein [Cyanobium sp. WAJ14-Wanaka]MCP9775214.1 GTP-binding protein [Cyanobium sp. WAJ14-Wanaka]